MDDYEFSADVREDLDNLLDDCYPFSADGKFASSKSYAITEAPNPLLRVSGLGSIGFPLGERDAEALLTVQRACPDGLIDAAKLTLDQPGWLKWLDSARFAVQKDIALPFSAYKPVVKGLWLYNSDSGSGPVATEGSDNPRLYVYFPSQFTGGQHEVELHGTTVQFNLAAESRQRSTVLAVYPHVVHTIAKIASGHAFCLVYDLVPTGEVGSPQSGWPSSRLDRALAHWDAVRALPTTPEYLVYKLQRRHSAGDGLSAASLDGDDALLLGVLAPVAAKRGVDLYLAQLQLETQTRCEIPAGDRLPHYMLADPETYAEEQYKADDWVARSRSHSVSVKALVHLDGTPAEWLKFEPSVTRTKKQRWGSKWEDQFVIPGGWIDMDEENDEFNDADERDFDQMDEHEAIKTRIWKPTVLIFWPKPLEGAEPSANSSDKLKRRLDDNEATSDVDTKKKSSLRYSNTPSLRIRCLHHSRGANSPAKLTHVSSRWRAVAVATPTLWRAIELFRIADNCDGTPPETREDELAVVETWLLRSQPLPLSIVMANKTQDLRPGFDSEAVNALLAHADRWEYVSLVLPYSYPLVYADGFGNAMPLLRELRLQDRRAETLLQLTHLDAPNLQYLSLEIMHRTCLSKVAPYMPLAQLTRLHLMDMDVLDWATILRQTPNLVSCRLDCEFAAIDEDAPWPPIELPKLETLIVRKDGLALNFGMYTFFNALRAPRLKNLSVNACLLWSDEQRNPLPLLTDMVAALGCSLELLRVEDAAEVDDYQEAFPHAERIEFVDVDAEAEALGSEWGSW
ncbi:Glycosyltransferase family 8 protein [Mycena kentingensis (nom. inval.)]|nr:Glycosyltransferase family 8 protein [Mycena kentingensis (nom. inval.)]